MKDRYEDELDVFGAGFETVALVAAVCFAGAAVLILLKMVL